MAYGVINIGILIVIGVILAMMVKNASGTKAFFGGLGNLWGRSINGLLGKSTAVKG